MTVACVYCNDPIDPDSSATWRRVTGWERKARSETRRGGSDVALRQPSDPPLFACQFCVEALRNGRSPSQEALL